MERNVDLNNMGSDFNNNTDSPSSFPPSPKRRTKVLTKRKPPTERPFLDDNAPRKRKSSAKKPVPPVSKKSRSRKKVTARADSGGEAPRKFVKAKKKGLSAAQKAWKKTLDGRVAEGRKFWDEMDAHVKEDIYKGCHFGKEGDPNFPVIDVNWIPSLPPRPKNKTRAETPGARGPTAAEPIVCGLCNLVLRDMFDAADHVIQHQQTHAPKCLLPIDGGANDLLAGSRVENRAGVIDLGQSLGSVEGAYEPCQYRAATLSTFNNHVKTKHTIAGAPLTMTFLSQFVPALYHRMRKPVPCDKDVPYHIMVVKVVRVSFSGLFLP